MSRALKVSDVVSAPAACFGKSFALSKGVPAAGWERNTTVRIEGKVTAKGKKAGEWTVNFGDDQAPEDWKRSTLVFVSRADNTATGAGGPTPNAGNGQARKAAVTVDSSEEDEMPGTGDCDSSDDEGAGEPDHGDAGAPLEGEWKRDDKYAFDERARQGFNSQEGPQMRSGEHGVPRTIFRMAMHFLPIVFLGLMATVMTETGLAKTDVHYKSWLVTPNDLIQWIGVWIYFLAFPQHGSDRRAYFDNVHFGPQHNLKRVLALGENGEKGIKWYENMVTCFTLPTWKRNEPDAAKCAEHGEPVARSAKYDKDDPFVKTRRFWDHLRTAFYYACQAAWLIVVDESMIQWQGRGMPGLMRNGSAA